MFKTAGRIGALILGLMAETEFIAVYWGIVVTIFLPFAFVIWLGFYLIMRGWSS